MSSRKVAAVIGIGPLVGEDICQGFARAGYDVALLSRSVNKLETVAKTLPRSEAHRCFRCDVTDAVSVREAFRAVRETLGEVDTVIYNPRDWNFKRLGQLSATEFEECWRVAALGLFHVAKELESPWIRRGHGVLGITGATASWRGLATTAAFAPAKAAQRSLAQALARDLGPRGVHVYLVVVDGVINEGGGDAVSPSAIADTHVFLASQPPSAWTFELNLTAAAGQLVTI